MTSPTGSIRPLKFPLRRSADNESQTPNAPEVSLLSLDGWQTSDSDERVDIVLNLSLNEYVALSTCIDVGRDIAYGDNSIYLWWIWVRSIVSLNICESVLDCIENDADVRDAINQLVMSQTSQLWLDNAQSQANDVLGSGNNPTCDLDILWGGINFLIDRANQNNIDVLEIFEAVTNNFELLSLIFPNTAEDGTSLINAGLDWVAWMQDNIIENYEANVTEGYLDDLKCDLFCLAQEDCILTPKMLTDYFFDRVSSSLTFESLFSATVSYLLAGTWSGTQIPDVFFLSQFALRAQVGGLLDFIGFVDIDKDMRIGFTDPSSAWSVLCACAQPPDYEFDFTTSQEGFSIYNDGINGPRGEWIDSVGFSQLWSDSRYRLSIYKDMDETLDIDKIDLDVEWEQSGNTNVMNQHDGDEDPPPLGTMIDSHDVSQDGEFSINYPSNYSTDYIVFNGANGTSGEMGTEGIMIITGMRIWLQ